MSHELVLQIRYHQQPLRPAVAWLISGEQVAGWLHELSRWNVSLDSLRLYIVPRAMQDTRPRGVLVVGCRNQSPALPWAQPYGLMGGSLYLPVEGRLDPELTDTELARLLDSDQVYVWHPAVGLVAFDQNQAHGVSDLMAPPTLRENLWNAARPGMAVTTRLLSIEPDQPPDLRSMLREGGGDIGTQTPAADDLPPAPDEPRSDAASRMGRSVRRSIARTVKWLTDKAPGGATQPTWIDSASDWARRQLQQSAASVDAERNRELLRLMHLLQSDPDQGLRFALPMGGDAPRGQAQPGSRLGEREPDFNLRRLGGGKAADYWNAPPDYRRRLVERYRELANREIALGRHRRAAYIFAELLNDLHAAAVTLNDGGHYREAATLYEERLKQPYAAAQCLERGGLWTEAIALYERLSQYDRVGDLYTQLEQPEVALAAYRRAVQARLAANDRLAAAVLLENKVLAPDEAYACLWAGWLQSSQRARCLEESFRLLARRADHELAGKQVVELRQSIRPLDHVLVAQGLAQVTATYPAANVRAVAADTARLVVAARLDQAPPVEESRTLTAAVAALVPADKLLERDCRRYAARQTPPPTPLPNKTGKCPIVQEFRLPPHEWVNAIMLQDSIVAAGYTRQQPTQMVVTCLDARGETSSEVLPCPPDSSHVLSSAIMLGVFSYTQHKIAVRRLFALQQQIRGSLPETSVRPAIQLGSFLSTPRTVAFAYGSEGLFYCIELDEDLSLSLKAYGSTDSLLGTSALRLEELQFQLHDKRSPLPMFVRGQDCFFAVGRRLFAVARGKVGSPWESQSGNIRQLTGTPVQTGLRIVAACERGAVVLWGNEAEISSSRTFAMQMISPVVGLTLNGWGVAATRDETQLYDTHDRNLPLGTTIQTGGDGNKSDPLAVLPLPTANRFALVLTDGRVLIHETPKRE